MNGLNVAQVKEFIIRPTLAQFPLRYDTEAAVNLLAGTMLVESGGVYIGQLSNGPGIGVCQMEQATHDDCYLTFLSYSENITLYKAVQSFVSPVSLLNLPLHVEMYGNLYYAFAMCRVKYIRSPDPLPAYNDAAALAAYHKAWYNTALGAADVTKNIPLFQEAINA